MLGDPTLVMRAADLELAEALSMKGDRPPGLVSGYQPERLLGRGAYGEVWVALDVNTGRRVAIKFYAHRGGLDWSLLSREVEKLSFLFNDRSVVQLLEVGWDADPPYYVMEYLGKGSLEDYLQSGPLPVTEALRLFREVAQALVNAHGKGVLHCDLKPANILLDDDLRPRLADFGQSRLTTDQTPALGTLFYMAPEQADLAAAPDARWDVYALGAIAYRMLTGATPFKEEKLASAIKDSTTLTERLAIYRQAIQGAPKPDRHRVVAGVDRHLAEIVDRCLAADPGRRYANPQIVLEALNQRALSRARRPLLIVGGLGPILVLLVVAVAAWSSFRTTVKATTAALRERANQGNEFSARFAAATVARQIDRRWVTLEKAALAGEVQAGLAHPDDPAERARLQAWLDQTRQATAAATEAKSWFLLDAQGRQLVRSPFNQQSRDRNYSWRDYFHGQGRDLPRGTTGLTPIQTVHLSPIFESDTVGTNMVAFSVPVWSRPTDGSAPVVIGVLAMTVEVGSFGEIEETPAQKDESTAHRQAILVDTRPDDDGERGLILQHPDLEEGAPNGQEPRFPAELVAKLLAEDGADTDNLPSAMVFGSFRDPILGTSDWLAAAAPVIVDGRHAAVGHTGWVVLIEQPEAEITGPVRALERRLLLRGTIALAFVVALIALFWALVMLALNGSPRSRLVSALRRRAGLGLDSLPVTPSSASYASGVRSSTAEPNRSTGAADG